LTEKVLYLIKPNFFYLFRLSRNVINTIGYFAIFRDQEDDDDVEDLRKDNGRLNKEIEELRSKHAAELNRMKKAYEKAVSEYKETNVELQKNVGLEPDLVVKTEAVEESDIFEDSLVGEEKKKAKAAAAEANPAKRKTSKTRTTIQTQVNSCP
jgi:hypothetical protein